MKLSIITINYNNHTGLKKTLSSVKSQIDKNFEYIVIDGASTDSSISLLHEYNDIISHCISESDTGIYNAMNKGIQKARGDFCIFLNSGDCFFNVEVSALLNSLPLNLNTIYFTDVQFEKNGILEKKLSYDVKPDTFFFASRYTLNHQNSIIPRKVLLENGLYDETLKFQADWFFFLEIAFKTNTKYQYLQNYIISVYDVSGMTMQTHNQQYIEKETFECISKLFGNYAFKIYKLYDLKKSANTVVKKINLVFYKVYLKFFLAILKRKIL